MSNIEQRILAEMIYDRVRATVNLCQLVIIEQELDEHIQRVLLRPDPDADADAGAGVNTGAGTDADTARPQPAALAREHVQRAWQRLEREWQTLREDLAHAEAE